MNFTNPHIEFRAIYADPPWNFRNYSNKGTGRNPVSHYDCMSLNDMKTLPVAQLTAKACALFLWVADPFLPAGLELISAWCQQRSKVDPSQRLKIDPIGSSTRQGLRAAPDAFVFFGPRY